jgi:hypothetical protein
MFALNTGLAREIESRYPTVPPGGVPEWYGLYRRIQDAGKSVRAVGVKLDEILPLLDALGGQAGQYTYYEVLSGQDRGRGAPRTSGVISLSFRPQR